MKELTIQRKAPDFQDCRLWIGTTIFYSQRTISGSRSEIRRRRLNKQKLYKELPNLRYKGTFSKHYHLIIPVAYTGKQRTETLYTLLPNAIIQYVDYLEIVEARKTAEAANLNANMALTVTVYAVIISVILGLGQIFLQVGPQLFKNVTP